MNNSNKKTQKKSISKSLKICYTIMNKTGNKNNKKKMLGRRKSYLLE